MVSSISASEEMQSTIKLQAEMLLVIETQTILQRKLEYL